MTGFWGGYRSGGPFSMHDRAGWEWLTVPGRPLYLRVFALAYCGHRRNGHCPFEAGGLRIALSEVDEETGVLRSPTRQAVDKAIAKAVELGFLDASSKLTAQRCLVVPPFVHGGTLGNEFARCPWHPRGP